MLAVLRLNLDRPVVRPWCDAVGLRLPTKMLG